MWECVCVFILRWALRALPASAPSAGMKGMCHYAHPQVDLKCGSGRGYALYFLGEVFCESARDGEQPFLFRWLASLSPYSWSRISRVTCQFVQRWLSGHSRCVWGSMWDLLEEVQEQILGLVGRTDFLGFQPFSAAGACVGQLAIICWRSLF